MVMEMLIRGQQKQQMCLKDAGSTAPFSRVQSAYLQGALAGSCCANICIAPGGCALPGAQGEKCRNHTCDSPFFQVPLNRGK